MVIGFSWTDRISLSSAYSVTRIKLGEVGWSHCTKCVIERERDREIER